MNVHLHAAQTHANLIVDNFWADRLKAEKLTVLQDRISQAGSLAETSRAALAIVHRAMLPLNDQPDGLPALLSDSRMGKPSTASSVNTSDAELWLPYPSCGSIPGGRHGIGKEVTSNA
jgi:hypothetical protein